jgi:lipoyl(octanoyl) transferase
MARDAYTLRTAGQTGVPRLRLYTWDRTTLSVGRAQAIEKQIDSAACAQAGIPIVRRMTGGRAVLHGSDLTYSWAAPLTGRFDSAARQGIPGLYRELSRVFVRFFDRLGLSPEVQVYTGRQRAELASPVCFATPSAFEILLGGRKIVGSAQRLLPAAFLQHGSIPLTPQDAVLAHVFREGAGADMAQHMTDLTSAGVYPSRSLPELRQILAQCFAEELELSLVPAEWSPAEEAQIGAMAEEYQDLGIALTPPVPAP